MISYFVQVSIHFWKHATFLSSIHQLRNILVDSFFSSYCVWGIPRNDWFIYNITPTLKTQWPTQERGQNPLKSQSARKPAILLCLLYMREATSMKRPNYGWLSNTWTMTTPVNIPIWMVQSSWGIKSYKQSRIAERSNIITPGDQTHTHRNYKYLCVFLCVCLCVYSWEGCRRKRKTEIF